MMNKLFLKIIFAALIILFQPELMFSLTQVAVGDTTGRVGSRFTVDVNNFKLPINNTGRTAYFSQGGGSGKLGEDYVLFSGGFALAGKTGNEIWTSNVMNIFRVTDFLPGILNDTTAHSKELYVVRKSDPPFGKSWQDWSDAVKFGAKFYDGDFDGVYNPIDKNGNGIWDLDEDMPYLLGDITVWCVYNDSEQNRRWTDTFPMGIEIQQTVFASNESHLQNTIFIMYSIINRGLITDSLINAYFSIWADPDIGDYEDDLTGSDTTIFSGYAYNSGVDLAIGDRPPALFFTFLQGPMVQDTTQGGFQFRAINNFGFYYGVYVYEGFNNLNPTSFQNHILLKGRGAVENKYTLYNRMLGLQPQEGVPVDPCNFNTGIVVPDTLCDKVNPYFFFSGDPVTGYGWINNRSTDQVIYLNIGPFNLYKDQPQHIIVAYTGAKGDSPLNSITAGKEIVRDVIQEYSNNFPSLTYIPGEPSYVIDNYELFQNYPNPFNPSTTIRYDLLEDGLVTLKVFDILGQEVKTLVNSFQPARRYEVQFNSEGLASGVYIYRLQINDFSQSKKMIILK